MQSPASHQPYEHDSRRHYPAAPMHDDCQGRRPSEHRAHTTHSAGRATLVVAISALALATSGCTRNPAPSVEEALLGTWELSIVSDENPVPENKPISLEILLEEGWFFGGELTTDCGLDGLFGDWSGDWREVEVTVGRSPKGEVSGSISTNCITSVHPVSGYHIQAHFFGGRMVGKITHQVDRGNKSLGPMYAALDVLLFVGRKRPAG